MLRIGIIGLSEGNGHPYSWSAICNSYDVQEMKDCPYPSIPDYLGQEAWPQSMIANAKVTHIWTQDAKISKSIAKASLIPTIVDKLEDLIPLVDAIILARDDAENHLAMSLPFINAGLPIFIDKPFALTLSDAHQMLEAQQYENQIFSCSSLRFSKDLELSVNELAELGKVQYVEASIPKYWDSYAVHILEPIISQLPKRGKLVDVTTFEKNGIKTAYIEWENVAANLKVTGSTPTTLAIRFMGENKQIDKIFTDSFYSFKRSIEAFISVALKNSANISRLETLEIVDIIERGNL